MGHCTAHVSDFASLVIGVMRRHSAKASRQRKEPSCHGLTMSNEFQSLSGQSLKCKSSAEFLVSTGNRSEIASPLAIRQIPVNVLFEISHHQLLESSGRSSHRNLRPLATVRSSQTPNRDPNDGRQESKLCRYVWFTRPKRIHGKCLTNRESTPWKLVVRANPP
jgi:hypothetical protein